MAENKIPYDSLTYEGMKLLALDRTIEDSERVGFPLKYRQGKESFIFDDIASKLTNLRLDGQTFVEIGSGFSRLSEYFITKLAERKTRMVFSDSEEMLSLFPKKTGCELIPGYFPDNWNAFSHLREQATAVLCYSVAQMVCTKGAVLSFLDHLTLLLKSGGQLLIGDIPNASKRFRFFSSEKGHAFHQKFLRDHSIEGNSTELPSDFLNPPPGSLDDSFVLSLVARFRSRGFEAYVLPQAEPLPFSNRREDILVIKH
jgi:hypothetical protein